MAIVLGIDMPVLEFLLILNIIMLFYVIISMFEIRSLVKLRKDLEILIEDVRELLHKPKPQKEKAQALPTHEKIETYSKTEEQSNKNQ